MVSNLLNGLPHKRIGGPGGLQTCNLQNEILEDLKALLTMGHFGVKLNPVQRTIRPLKGRIGNRFGGSNAPSPGGQLNDGIAVRHPNLGCLRQSFEERRTHRTMDLQYGPTVFPNDRTCDRSTPVGRQPLGAVTNTQNGDPLKPGGPRDNGGLGVVG